MTINRNKKNSKTIGTSWTIIFLAEQEVCGIYLFIYLFRWYKYKTQPLKRNNNERLLLGCLQAFLKLDHKGPKSLLQYINIAPLNLMVLRTFTLALNPPNNTGRIVWWRTAYGRHGYKVDDGEYKLSQRSVLQFSSLPPVAVTPHFKAGGERKASLRLLMFFLVVLFTPHLLLS